MRIQGPIPENILKRLPADVRKKMGKAGKTLDEVLIQAENKSEKTLQEQIKSFLDRNAIYYVWSRMDKKTTTRTGTPDFIICFQGSFIAIECKTAVGVQSDEQKRHQNMIQKNLGVYHLVRSYRDFFEIFKKGVE